MSMDSRKTEMLAPTNASGEPPGSALAATVVGSSPQALSGKFGKYEIVRLLGRGGMGAVYLARQVDLDRPAVIKVILSAEADGAVERFQREAKAAARVASDHVVQVYETGVEQGVPFIAMEYVEGRSAADALSEQGRLEWSDATQLLAAAARGLADAHRVGVLHRDVKPANILVAKDGRVKVADFGLAKFVQTEQSKASNPALTSAGMILGTCAYMSPEQAQGEELDGRADVYSLGASYFHLLTGRTPFLGATSLAMLQSMLTGPVPSVRELVPEIPLSVDRLCAKLMAKDRADRPASAEEALAALARIVQISPSGRAPLSLVGPDAGERATTASGAPSRRSTQAASPVPPTVSGVRGPAAPEPAASHAPLIAASLLALAVLASAAAHAWHRSAGAAAASTPPPAPVATAPPAPTPPPESAGPSESSDGASDAAEGSPEPTPVHADALAEKDTAPRAAPLPPAATPSAPAPTATHPATAAWADDQWEAARTRCTDAFVKDSPSADDNKATEAMATDVLDQDHREWRAHPGAGTRSRARGGAVAACLLIRGSLRALRGDFEESEADFDADVNHWASGKRWFPQMASLCGALLAKNSELGHKRRTEVDGNPDAKRFAAYLDVALQSHQLPTVSDMGKQAHSKVLGVFARRALEKLLGKK